MRTISVTYEVITPESAEEGDVAERGWENEEGYNVEPSEEDREDGSTAVDNAVRFLRGEGPVEASCYPSWSRGTWYTQTDGSTEYSTGAERRLSFHLSGFIEEEEKEIYARITGRRF